MQEKQLWGQMPVFLVFVCVVVASAIAYRYWTKRQARAQLLAAPLTAHQRAVIADYVPLSQRLPQDPRAGFEGKVNVFLDQVEFIGCDGLEVSEEMELSIAAQACLLVANTEAWYRHLSTVLIYPGAFKSREQHTDGFVVTERETVRLGESWARGPVVLSWAHSERGALNETDGHNVVLHEFAHQIDGLSGHTDGAPVLHKGQSYAAWEHVFVQAFERLTRDVQAGRLSVLDAYGATSYEEYFAVAVEVFFEKPEALQQEEPEVYAQLSALFQLDPVTWD